MTKQRQKILNNKLLVGRHEWCQLDGINIPVIKAKIDTGAKTSAIHAFNINVVKEKNNDVVYFDVHPIQRNEEVVVHCKASIIDERNIMSSNGQRECRYVILTPLIMGEQCWDIELTLSNREPLTYRMLLGREALNNRVLIDPSRTCNQLKMKKEKVMLAYGYSNY